ncbi:MAG TPA: DUF2892 domain-containing protein [Bacillales bacterium]|nr:DUF2892 domain-containing protein [Bacillales bacterium]
MKPNIGGFNALMRITCGLTVLAWATSRLAQRPKRLSMMFTALMGAMKVAEGMERYCVLTDLIKKWKKQRSAQ